MRILILFPSLYNGWDVLGKHFEASAINHGLASISAVLKQDGHEVGLLDMRGLTGWEQFEQTIKSLNFDVCLIGFHSVDMSFADKAIRIVKKIFPEIPVIAGGVHITYSEGIEKFSLADCIVQGEGELVTLDLIDQIAKGQSIPHKVISKTIEDLDSLPFVDRNLFNQKHENNNPILPLLPKPFFTINFSRGCGFRCSYCLESKNLLWKGHRKRSALNCIEEIRSLGEVGSLMLHDDHLPFDQNWIYNFYLLWKSKIKKRIPFWCQLRADSIIRRKEIIPKLAEIGMTWVSMGLEGSQRFLDFYNKHLTVDQIIQAAEILHQNKINIFLNYITGAPTETDADIAELELILQRIKPAWHSASIYTSYPGSRLYDWIEKNKLWLEPIEDKNNHYNLQRFPFERKLAGVDYRKLMNETIPRLTSYKSELKIYEA
jgi:radical SAM superfamily enzyme YgiQ (UPF0313 family)